MLFIAILILYRIGWEHVEVSVGRDLIEYVLFLFLLLVATKPLGNYLELVFDGSPNFLSTAVGPLERFFYRVTGVEPNEEQSWVTYSTHLLIFSGISLLVTYGLLRMQHQLPLNPTQAGEISPHLAFNIAMSFVTNTNWQSYSGETDLSYFSQMVALTVQNFLSAAVGLAAAVAVIRGLAAHQTATIGNFWTDLVRGTLYVFLPICILSAIFYISQGIIQNFLPAQEVLTLEGAKQMISQGPVASQVAIKILGTNGGGFFNANAAHPYENPTPLSNFVQILSMLLLPSALIYLLGKKLKQVRHAWAIWIAMMALLSFRNCDLHPV